MSVEKEPKSINPFKDDDLDEEVRAADDTGMVAQQQEINAKEALLDEQDDSDA